MCVCVQDKCKIDTDNLREIFFFRFETRCLMNSKFCVRKCNHKNVRRKKRRRRRRMMRMEKTKLIIIIIGAAAEAAVAIAFTVTSELKSDTHNKFVSFDAFRYRAYSSADTSRSHLSIHPCTQSTYTCQHRQSRQYSDDECGNND